VGGCEIRPSRAGAQFRVRVTARAREDRVGGLHGGALKVAVRAAAERGRANEAVTRLLAEVLGARGQEVSIVKGSTARDKWILVEGWTCERLAAVIARLS